MRRAESIASADFTYTAVFEPADEGGYVVSFPAFPGIVTQGETLAEAREAAADLLRGYLQLMHERGRPLPPSDARPGPIREPLTVSLRRA